MDKILDKKKILVYGAGSLGSFLSAKLLRAGHNVDVVGRGKAKQIGSTLLINDEKYKFPSVSETVDGDKYYDYIMITSKYYDLKRNLENLVNSGVKSGAIILIQNTYTDNFWYYHLIKDRPIVVMSIIEGFNLSGNNLTFRPAAGWFVEDDILGRDVYVLFKNSGLNISLTDEINVKRAEKSIYNCSLNIFCALYHLPIDKLFQNKPILNKMKLVFEESYTILSEFVPLKSRRVLWKTFSDNYKHMNHYASTYQDVIANKKTELSFLNGFIIELGRKMDTETPYNSEVVREFKKKYPKLY